MSIASGFSRSCKTITRGAQAPPLPPGDVRPPFRDQSLHSPGGRGHRRFGAHMASGHAEGKPADARRGAQYSTWSTAGSERPRFPNIIGILTETSAIRRDQHSVHATQSATESWWPSAAGRMAHAPVGRVLDAAKRAILDFASRTARRTLQMYVMGRDGIKWGNADHWTFSPIAWSAGGRLEAAAVVVAANPPSARRARRRRTRRRGGATRTLHGVTTPRCAIARLHPAVEPGRLGRRRLVNTLTRPSHVTRDGRVHRAGKQSRPIVRRQTAQAFRPNSWTCRAQGSCRTTPYAGRHADRRTTSRAHAGVQMRRQFDRILDAFDGR